MKDKETPVTMEFLTKVAHLDEDIMKHQKAIISYLSLITENVKGLDQYNTNLAMMENYANYLQGRVEKLRALIDFKNKYRDEITALRKLVK